MKIQGKDYRSIWLEDQTVQFIDQRKLPYTFTIYSAKTVEEIVFVIKEMVVRGAPAIGAAGAYAMALGSQDIEATAEKLRKTRPTAYDLFYAIEYMRKNIKTRKDPWETATIYVEDIVNRCKKLGEYGERLISDGMTILTHCNAGALATVDYGTALAPIRIAQRKGKHLFVYVDETRPRCQGFLTAWELEQEKIPYTLIVDNAAGHYMNQGAIDLIITGADRIAANGDFANKIGTYEKAVCAKENNIPFYVAAPLSTFDPSMKNGKEIIIEERSKTELAQIAGKTIMPEWIPVKNPAFDITPAKYVTSYITEKGIQKNIT